MRAPLRDAPPPFLRLVERLRPLLGPPADAVPLPTDADFAVCGFRADFLPDATLRLEHRAGLVDPYGGGDRYTQRLVFSPNDGRKLDVTLAEVAWVGPELRVRIDGPPAFVAEVTGMIEAYAGCALEAD